MLNIECIKFPECLGCRHVTKMIWRETGSFVRVCRNYPNPRGWWRRGGCPLVHKSADEFGGKKRAGYTKRKDAAYLTKRGRVAT